MFLVSVHISSAKGKFDSNQSSHAVVPSLLISIHSNGSWYWVRNDGRCGEAGMRRRQQRGRQMICGPRPGSSRLRGEQRVKARRCGPRTRASGVRTPLGASRSQLLCCSIVHLPPDARVHASCILLNWPHWPGTPGVPQQAQSRSVALCINGSSTHREHRQAH